MIRREDGMDQDVLVLRHRLRRVTALGLVQLEAHLLDEGGGDDEEEGRREVNSFFVRASIRETCGEVQLRRGRVGFKAAG